MARHGQTSQSEISNLSYSIKEPNSYAIIPNRVRVVRRTTTHLPMLQHGHDLPPTLHTSLSTQRSRLYLSYMWAYRKPKSSQRTT